MARLSLLLLTLATIVLFICCAADDVDLSKLKMSELKARLAAKGADCHGCAEKKDYIQRVRETLPWPDVSSSSSSDSSDPPSTSTDQSSEAPVSDADKRKQDAANPAGKTKPKSPLDGVDDDAAVDNIVEMLRKQGLNFDVFGKKDIDEMTKTGNYDKFQKKFGGKKGGADSDKPRKKSKKPKKKSTKQRQQEQQQMEQQLRQQRVEEMEEEEPIHLHDEM